MTSRFERLPAELLDRVLCGFDSTCTQAMHNLCLASRKFDTVIRQYLYREPSLVGPSLIRFAKTILQNKHLAQLVQKLHVTILDYEKRVDLDAEDVRYLRTCAFNSGRYTISHLHCGSSGPARTWAFYHGMALDLTLAHLRNLVELSVAWQSGQAIPVFYGTGRRTGAEDLLPRLRHVSYDGHNGMLLRPRGRLDALAPLLSKCSPTSLYVQGIHVFDCPLKIGDFFTSVLRVELVNCRRLKAWELSRFI